MPRPISSPLIALLILLPLPIAAQSDPPDLQG